MGGHSWHVQISYEQSHVGSSLRRCRQDFYPLVLVESFHPCNVEKPGRLYAQRCHVEGRSIAEKLKYVGYVKLLSLPSNFMKLCCGGVVYYAQGHNFSLHIFPPFTSFLSQVLYMD